MSFHSHRGTLAVLILAAGVAVASHPAAAVDATAWIDALRIRPGVPLVSLPPEAGAVIAVDERRAIDRYVQTVTLQGDPGTVGENRIVLTVTRDGLAPRIEDESLTAEAADRLPPMAMTLGSADTRDGLGAFGSAVGSKGALACLYAWQAVDLADRWISGDQPSIFQERHALTLRVRLCRTDRSARDLLALMAGLRSGIGDEAVTPVRETAAGDDAMAAALDLHQIGSAEPKPLAPAPRIVRVVRPHPRVARAAPARRRVAPPRIPAPTEAPAAAAMAGMAQVPLPQ